MALLSTVAIRWAKRLASHEGVELAGLYWHFVDLVWVFIFTLFYLVLGGRREGKGARDSIGTPQQLYWATWLALLALTILMLLVAVLLKASLIGGGRRGPLRPVHSSQS